MKIISKNLLHWRLGDEALEKNRGLMGKINVIQIQKVFKTNQADVIQYIILYITVNRSTSFLCYLSQLPKHISQIAAVGSTGREWVDFWTGCNKMHSNQIFHDFLH